MFQKITICASLAVLLSACSTTMAPVMGNHYASNDGTVHIRGELVDSSNVRIFVNDAKVIEDHVSLLKGDGDFSGSFQGKPVRATCATQGGPTLSGTTCLVAFGGERVTLAL
jgi:type 1 fimbria pilin